MSSIQYITSAASCLSLALPSTCSGPVVLRYTYRCKKHPVTDTEPRGVRASHYLIV